ncbi:putative acetyltransferase [Mycolicibacterium rhodesiae NBB3]|jgi:predicted GNAT family acetyltransferase|uniref:Putative acetyltransferase n=1 Tax=Mycolicibacterium rhodesiae (strain NBB3) TaxID=710685 RepID=G8RMG3_MYCRN|nr:GNAT family N-acetyltransferase [Mycolicibacterium rhodesiae]AEV72460.1 putative acetyltransferase [Mycolicibacterium rhodesiae NBB3]
MATDKTGATTTVTQEADRFTISVDGTVAGFTEIDDRDGTRTFPHTEVDDAFQGRGLASILIGEALQQTRDAGLKIVPVCSMVKNYIEKHPEFDDVAAT